MNQNDGLKSIPIPSFRSHLQVNALPFAELGDYMRNMVYIIQAYVLLSPHDFLRSCGPAFAANLDDQFGDLQDEGVLLILRLVDLVTKVGPPETPVIFKGLIMRSYQ